MTAPAASDPAIIAPLAPCVHCGFCLPACPTYRATGDEGHSPRGRIVLMRALARGEAGPDDAGLREHLDACLGCRGCEPVCPSGVEYGRGLTAARAALARARGLPALARLALDTFRQTGRWRTVLGAARAFRDAGGAAALAGGGRLGTACAMLAATAPDPILAGPEAPAPARRLKARGTVALFRGCVMDELFRHVHEATRLALQANGFDVLEVVGQQCCGALHEHAGDPDGARALAHANLAAFGERFDYVAVNSAGCGALLKDYGHLLGTEAAERFAARVRDVTELLAGQLAEPIAPLPLDVVYDGPCHLQHAQGVQEAPLAVLRAIPGLRLRLLAGSDQCCGSAGIFSLLEPAMARAVLDAKIREIAAARPRPALVVTGNPGCLMQIGAGLRLAGLPIGVAHPVELLARAYAGGWRTREQ